MSSAKWTLEQKKAIEARNSNLLIAAAAGAGKTAVLVERIIQRIMDADNPVDIDKLLVVTFTNAAASEMRERIGNAISGVLEKQPDSQKLQRQMALLSRAHITTIHSFCLEVIRSNFHMLDLDPAFKIADETESVLLKQEAMEEVFDERYEEGLNEGFLNLVDSFGGNKSDNSLKEMVLKLYGFSQAMPYPEEWLYEVAERFDVDGDFDFDSSIWADILREDIKIELSGIISNMKKAADMLDGASGLENYYEHILNEYRALQEIENKSSGSWDELRDIINSFEFERLPRVKKEADKEVQEIAKDLRDSVKEALRKSRDVLKLTLDEIKEQMKKMHPDMKALVNTVVLFSQRYNLKKREKGVIDFNDIEHYCIQILTQREGKIVTPSKAAVRYRDEFEEILIDEYQDSNMVQELILTNISKVPVGQYNIFMVGDVKQSIYRFRQAKPELFLHKYNTYSDDDNGKKRRILLYKNFRSRKEVIGGVNYVFKGLMSKTIGELEYTDDEKLNPGADYPEIEDEEALCGGPIELHIIESDKVEEEEEENEDEEVVEVDEEQEDIDSVRLEAMMVAERINNLLYRNGQKSFKVYDKNINGYRPVEYRDIVILMRATSSFAPIFTEELLNAGIPVFADTGSGYFDTDEIQTVLSLLMIIDNPMQDVPLISVLRSPIAPFSPEELLDTRMAAANKTFYEAIKEKTKAEDDLGKKCREFLEFLEKLRDKAVNMPISEFIWFLYNETGYYAYASAMPGGIQRQGNLRILFERAREYESTSLKGLFNFINFIKKLQKSSGDMGSAKILGENENVVRIMSIHKSKGLEFPVTILSGLGRKFNMRDLNSPVLFHHELGLGPDFVDNKMRYRYQTIIKQALKKKIRFESLSEEMRILYVALTRAREKLILTGTVNNVDKLCGYCGKAADGLGIKIPEYHVINSKNFLHWIFPVILKHRSLNELREAANLMDMPMEAIIDDPSLWEVKFHKMKDILSCRNEKVEEETAVMDEAEEEEETSPLAHEVVRRLNWVYGYSYASKLPAKLSVTELKKRMGTNIDDEYTQSIFEEPINKTPSFMKEKSDLSASERGTVMHSIMQHMDLGKILKTQDVEALIKELVDSELLTEVQAKTVNIKKVIEFFESPIGKRLNFAKNVRREMPFYMEIDSTEVFKGLPYDKYKDEKILLQGIIDCYFEEEDGLVLLDYKTDYVNDDNLELIKQKYKSQIEYYKNALEQMTGKKVKEKYIYLFYNGQVLKY
ncbi:ATP-dependent helicase/nuclease subunit A [Oxobacter pfennigii]|uniref:ATP-dependent helicase/nuclease subunit A n=1 Tax=Oxobacter pfennigii TaxID=36849 RepID=A0A0P9AJ07_9CLOT|nr:helicase-exonuclease AddAB subunit AddA [Oxobacter pfennigii]KPU45427.1 ATP-dependent helicase/nuclease subunit A [Oxobacter pfennigii]